MDEKRKIIELDKEIIQLGLSTKTLFPWFISWHNFFRMKSRFYYNWHLNPKSAMTHYIILVFSIIITASIVAISYLNPFVPKGVASSPITLNSQADWQAGTSNTGIDLISSPGDMKLSSGNPSWTQATASAGWSVRSNNTSLVYDNKMWVMGGYASGNTYKNDVWYSTDGITWTQATTAAGWVGRSEHTSLVYDNKMWILGGTTGISLKNDVWYSIDGITWTQATAAAGWDARREHTSLVYDNKMWVLGGRTTGSKNDVWYSTDGITWTQATSTAGWTIRYNHVSLVYDNKMWVLGGYLNDVWNSSWSGVHTTSSTQIDAGADLTGWTTFEPSATIPANTAISFRFRTSADGSAWTAWSSSTPYAASIDISGQSSSNRYLQIESTLSNTDGVSIPIISSFAVNFTAGEPAVTLDHLEIKISSESDSSYAASRTVSLEASQAGSTVTLSARGIDNLGASMLGLTFTYSSTACTKTGDNQFAAPSTGNSCTISVISDQGGEAMLSLAIQSSGQGGETLPDNPESIFTEINPENIVLKINQVKTFIASVHNQNDKDITSECSFEWEILKENAGTIVSTNKNIADFKASIIPGDYGETIKTTATCGELSDSASSQVAVINDDLTTNENSDWILRSTFEQLNTKMDRAVKIIFELWIGFKPSGRLYRFENPEVAINLTNQEAGEFSKNRVGNDFRYFIPRKEGCYPNLFQGKVEINGKKYTAFSGLNIASNDKESFYYQFQPVFDDILIRPLSLRSNEKVDYHGGGQAFALDSSKQRFPHNSPYYEYSKSGNRYDFTYLPYDFHFVLNDPRIGTLTNGGKLKASSNLESIDYPNSISVNFVFGSLKFTKQFNIKGIGSEPLKYRLREFSDTLFLPPDTIFNLSSIPKIGEYYDQWNGLMPGFYNVKSDPTVVEQYQPQELYFKTSTKEGNYPNAIKIKAVKPGVEEEKLINLVVDSKYTVDSCRPILQTKGNPVPPNPPSPPGEEIPTNPVTDSVISIIISLPFILWLIKVPKLLRFLYNSLSSFWILFLTGLRGRKRGYVFDFNTKKPIEGAKVQLFDAKKNRLIYSFLTNEKGEFKISLGEGEYFFKVFKRNYKPYHFVPIKLHQETNLSKSDGYYDSLYFLEEIINPKRLSETQTGISIPMKAIEKKTPKIKKILLFLWGILTRYSIIFLIAGTIFTILLFVYSSQDIVNQLLLAYYAILWILQIYLWYLFKKMKGKILDDDNNPVLKALVEILNQKGNLVQMAVTNKKGNFVVSLKREKYLLKIKKPDFNEKEIEMDLTKIFDFKNLKIILNKQ